MSRQKYELDETFFDCIDTEEKAYILGFIFADGNITCDSHYRLRITLKIDDLELLEKIKDCIKFSGSIHTRELKSLKRNTSGYEICELSISNKHLIQSLIKLGAVPNKTFVIKYPNIPDNLDRHFIRGFFDGDGSIYERRDRKNGVCAEVSCASKQFICVLKSKVESSINTPVKLYSKKTVEVLKLSQNKARLFLDYMYKDSSLYLDRKFILYKTL